MDFDRILDVMVICAPVFGIIGIGKLLGVRGTLNEDRRHFLNWLVYYFALPALIFGEIAKQEFSSIARPALLIAPMAAIAPVVLAYVLLARMQKYRGGFAASFVFGTFWANTAYVGFPLASNAFGQEGLASAAIYNIVAIPVFISLGYALIAAYGTGSESRRSRIWQALLNPIIIAALLGVAVSYLAEFLRAPDGRLDVPGWADGVLKLAGSFLTLMGNMGLPLALLAIGASLRLSRFARHWGAAAATTAGKLVVLPLAALALLAIFFPEADAMTKAMAVLMAAMPVSVSSFVISRQAGMDDDLVPSLLVLSHAAAAVTIPVWLYLVL